VQHEAAHFHPGQGFDALLVVAVAECQGDQALRLAAREQRRAVRAGQNASLDGDLANLVQLAAVETGAGLDDLVTANLGLEAADDFKDL
jgi:hypothetical protein